MNARNRLFEEPSWQDLACLLPGQRLPVTAVYSTTTFETGPHRIHRAREAEDALLVYHFVRFGIPETAPRGSVVSLLVYCANARFPVLRQYCSFVHEPELRVPPRASLLRDICSVWFTLCHALQRTCLWDVNGDVRISRLGCIDRLVCESMACPTLFLNHHKQHQQRNTFLARDSLQVTRRRVGTDVASEESGL